MIALLITLLLTPTAAPAAAPLTSLAREESTLVNEQARVTVKYERGVTSILKVERQPLPSPQKMRRWRGRFEARAVAAGKTVDFVRFDFPLMAEAEAPDDVTVDAKKLGKNLRDHVTATTIVRVPLPAGATAIAIYDGATKKSATADLPAAGAGSTRK